MQMQISINNKFAHKLKLQNMQKWQQKQRQKAHESKVENAKSSFKRYSNSRQKSMNISRAKQVPALCPKNQIPLNKILQIFHLQHYGPLLNSYKFTQNLASLETINDQNEYIYEILQQVQPQDKQRFESLLHTLMVMSKSMNNEKILKSKYNKKSLAYPIFPPPASTSSHANQTPSSMPKTNKSQSRFRIKVKNSPNSSNTPKMSSKNVVINNSGSRNISTKEVELLSDKTKKRRKSISHGLPNGKNKASDDVNLVHNFDIHDTKNEQGKLKNVNKCSKIIKKLSEKLQVLEPSRQQVPREDINLQYNKIKQMYLSFDSATMTSNINNIDLQQLTRCFAMQIISILASCQIQSLVKTNQDKIKSLLRESFIVVRQQQRQSITQLDSMNQSQEKQINPQKMARQNESKQSERESGQEQEEEQEQDDKIYVSNNYQQQDRPSQALQSCFTSQGEGHNLQIKLKQSPESNDHMMASSIWGNNYIASVIQDFTCFDNSFRDESYEKQPNADDIKNFVDLIMMAGKIQKQVPILAYVYITRLLKSVKGSKITRKNWRNIILITLIQGSKIWDDRSLQNHSFAKVIKPYTTLQLNRLEKYLLFFIDYHLNINQKQYSQSYFALRKHSGQNCHTVNLVKLDLKTIKKLQSIQSCENKQTIDKKQFMRKCMNKSF